MRLQDNVRELRSLRTQREEQLKALRTMVAALTDEERHGGVSAEHPLVDAYLRLQHIDNEISAAERLIIAAGGGFKEVA